MMKADENGQMSGWEAIWEELEDMDLKKQL